MNHNPDTPRTDACPHCGAGQLLPKYRYYCGTDPLLDRKASMETRTELCKEREARQKAEAEVERLREALQLCFWATNTYEGNYTRACDNVATIAIEALKTQDK